MICKMLAMCYLLWASFVMIENEQYFLFLVYFIPFVLITRNLFKPLLDEN